MADGVRAVAGGRAVYDSLREAVGGAARGVRDARGRRPGTRAGSMARGPDRHQESINVRYLFRGLVRDTGQPVVGHCEATTEEEAYTALADHGIVTEQLTADPKPMPAVPQNLPGMGGGAGQLPGPSGQFADALDSALDTSATQIEFDQLTERYRGKRVWVIDRDKIRRRVAQVVDQAITGAQAQIQAGADAGDLRKTVAEAIEGLFRDNKNITSPADQVAAAQNGGGGGGVAESSPALEEQVTRLTQVVAQMQGMMAQLSTAIRNVGSGGGGGGGGGGGRRRFAKTARPESNEVLMEIFRSNMQLQRGVEIPKEGGGGAAPEPVAAAVDAGGGGGGDEPAVVAAGDDQRPA
jgi:hypothetical protein